MTLFIPDSYWVERADEFDRDEESFEREEDDKNYMADLAYDRKVDEEMEDRP